LYTPCVLGLRPSALLNEFLLIKKNFEHVLPVRHKKLKYHHKVQFHLVTRQCEI